MEIPNIPFAEWPKISRWSREVVVTEKIDGTNAQIYIDDTMTTIHAGSRNKWITPADDNKGFARWVEENKDELIKLGPGSHFGEWWGSGIGRNYGLKEKRFSLFNVHRWGNDATRPKPCGVVPVLWRGMMHELNVLDIMTKLAETGSIVAPGFKNPEGVVIFCTAGGQLFKKTYGPEDAGGKG